MKIDIALVPVLFICVIMYGLMFWHIYTYFEDYKKKLKKEKDRPDLKLIKPVDKTNEEC